MKNRRTPLFRTIVLLFMLVMGLLFFSHCDKETGKVPLTWQEKYTGNYTFTTIYHNAMYFVNDTSVFNGTSSIKDESTHLLKIDYSPGLTLCPHVSDTGSLYVENTGSHGSFTGNFSLDGKSVHFFMSSYYESWDVTGEKHL